jgi:hypothetical protein
LEVVRPVRRTELQLWSWCFRIKNVCGVYLLWSRCCGFFMYRPLIWILKKQEI